MAAAATKTEAPTAEAPPAGGGTKLLIIGALSGLLVGGAAGVFVLGPRLGANHPAAPGAKGAATAEAEAPPPAPRIVHSIENLVVNPAQTNGARFLMVTCAIEVKDAAALEQVKSREAEVRDRMVDLLSSKTIGDLTTAAAREPLKAELAVAVSSLFPAGTVTRVLLPQFVIQ